MTIKEIENKIEEMYGNESAVVRELCEMSDLILIDYENAEEYFYPNSVSLSNLIKSYYDDYIEDEEDGENE